MTDIWFRYITTVCRPMLWLPAQKPQLVLCLTTYRKIVRVGRWRLNDNTLYSVLKKLCQLIFCFLSVKYEPISIKIVRIVPEQTLNKTVPKMPTSPEMCLHYLRKFEISISKCPPVTRTQARRRWRHSLTALSITMCHPIILMFVAHLLFSEHPCPQWSIET